MFKKKVEKDDYKGYYRQTLIQIRELLGAIEKNEMNVWPFIENESPTGMQKISEIIKRNQMKLQSLKLHLLQFQEDKKKVNHEGLRKNIERLENLLANQVQVLGAKIVERQNMSKEELVNVANGQKIEEHKSEASTLINFIKGVLMPEIDSALVWENK